MCLASDGEGGHLPSWLSTLGKVYRLEVRPKSCTTSLYVYNCTIIFFLSRALSSQYPELILPIVEDLSSSLSSIYDPQRITVVAFYSEVSKPTVDLNVHSILFFIVPSISSLSSTPLSFLL